ncbi:HAMP domain-containing histidine kinase [Undibacterium sp. CY7W]|uniref:histidine kinase n=1 Tax=Undibacterium rugosum TaxID=2762291 RepID=A0A923IBG9_9BURK|nr:HAMP domain-containing sensor histidine kinase [Undibacterium rugosum]MBC3936195.1 HAMP domain-containing histidine kinase [Undibacterium rugosum]
MGFQKHNPITAFWHYLLIAVALACLLALGCYLLDRPQSGSTFLLYLLLLPTGLVLILTAYWRWDLSRGFADIEAQRCHDAAELALLQERADSLTKALDLSNQRLIEALQQIDQMRHQFIENERYLMLDALVHGVASELVSPVSNLVLLNSTLADASVQLRKLAEGEVTRSGLRNISAQFQQGTSMLSLNLQRVDDLMSSVKQLVSGQRNSEKREFSLQTLLDESCAALQSRVRLSNHVMLVDVEYGIVMNSHPGAITQLVLNLFNNAFVHALEGVEKGLISLQASKADEGTVKIIFSDNGNGIDDSLLKEILQPMLLRKMGKADSGLGLHVCQHLVSFVLGGRMLVESKRGQGTTITMYLPLEAPDVATNTIKIGVPKDVYDDWQMIQQQGQAEYAAFQAHERLRRDLVELYFLMQALRTCWSGAETVLLPVTDYATGLRMLQTGQLSALGTTVWQMDACAIASDVLLSAPVITEEQSLVGIYTLLGNEMALRCRKKEDLRDLRFVCSKDWSVDWTTLQHLGVKHCLDMKNWHEMVLMLAEGEVDAILAPFSMRDDLALLVDGHVFVPLPGIRVALRGSRHFALSPVEYGPQLVEKVMPAILAQVEGGQFAAALLECGYLNQATSAWEIW